MQDEQMRWGVAEGVGARSGCNLVPPLPLSSVFIIIVILFFVFLLAYAWPT